MDDLYARLKPPVVALTDADRAALRRSLFGSVEPSRATPAGGTTVRLAPDAPRRRLVTVAASLLAVAGLSGLFLATRGAQGGSGSAGTVPPATVPDAAADLPAVPRLLLDVPGWSLTRVDDVPGTAIGRGRGVTIAPIGTFPDGPWASVDATNGSTDLDGTVPPFPESTVLDVAEHDVVVSRLDRITGASWSTPDGVSFGLAGWDLDDGTVRQIAAATVFDGVDSVTVTPPPGWETVDPDVAALLDRQVEYEFTDATPPAPVTTAPSAGDAALAAGSVLTVRPIFGGEYALRTRVSVDGPFVSERAVDGEAVYVEHEDGQRFTRIHVLRDGWVWEVDAEGDVSTPDDALALFAQLRVVDEATWRAALPAGFVSPDERQAVVADLLDGVPTPASFDTSALASGGTTDRYQVVAQVSGAVACAWLDQWFSAKESGDTATQQAAAAALATSRTWPMLLEIDAQGGWSAAIWEWAEAVNGGTGVATGAGSAPPERDLARSGIGCAF